VGFTGVFSEVETAETPGVVVAQPRPIFDLNVQMIVQARGLIRLHHAQAARHTQVRDQRSGVCFDQNVFGASADASNDATRKVVG